jgi:hypothetical protein
MAFLTQNKSKLCKILIITLVFEKNAIFSLKIAIITLTPCLECILCIFRLFSGQVSLRQRLRRLRHERRGHDQELQVQRDATGGGRDP